MAPWAFCEQTFADCLEIEMALACHLKRQRLAALARMLFRHMFSELLFHLQTGLRGINHVGLRHKQTTS